MTPIAEQHAAIAARLAEIQAAEGRAVQPVRQEPAPDRVWTYGIGGVPVAPWPAMYGGQDGG